MKTKIRIRNVLILLGLLILYEVATLIYTMIDDQETSSKISLVEYNNLFNEDVQSKLQILATFKNRHRAAGSTYLYDHKYNLAVFKVDLSNDIELSRIIHYKNEASSKSLNAFYEGLPCFNFDMSIKAGKTQPVSELYFKSSGDLIRPVISNDSLFCYYFEFNTFSIHYNDLPYDIIAMGDKSNIPASVVFKKKGKFLYIIIMTIAKEKVEMKTDQLYNIIKL